MSKLIYTKEQEKAIIDYYLAPHSLKETSSFFNISKYYLEKILKKNKVTLHSKATILKMTSLKLYGCENPFQAESIKTKSKKTCLTNYGVESFSKTEQFKEKVKQTCLEKYGTEYYSQTAEFLEEATETCLKRYGETSYTKTKECQDKIKQTKKQRYNNETFVNSAKAKQTCLEKYGVDNFAKTDDFKQFYTQHTNEFIQKYKQTCLEKYGVDNFTKTGWYIEKSKQTCLDKYGEDNFTKTDLYKEKSKNTCLEKYGTEFFAQSDTYQKHLPGFLQKQFETKKKNGTFNTSKPEEEYYKLLCEKYSKQDVFRQYKDERYPFACDFYIKSIDTFIELNINWTHGPHRFNPDSTEDLQLLAHLEEKSMNSEFYKNAIQTWTIRDVEKFKAAENNNLNYIVFYSTDELYVI